MATPSQSPANFPEMINKIQAQLDALGPGPHSEADQEKIKNLKILLIKAQQENQKTPLPQATATIYAQPAVQPKPLPQPAAAPASMIVIDQANIAPAAAATPSTHKILDRKRLQDLVKEIDPMAQMEEDVEEVLMQIADDFIENVVNASCEIAKHRHSDTLEVKDVQLYLDRAWNMWIPGFGSDELRPYRRAPTSEAHKQRVALIKKTLKKS